MANRLGNTTQTPMQQLVASAEQTKFGQDKRDTLTQYCLDCDVRFACNGGCPKDRFATSTASRASTYLCPGYKRLFRHVDRPMRAIADLLATNRAPAELMQIYAAEDAHRGRNEPCTCGSGRKWKRGGNATASAPEYLAGSCTSAWRMSSSWAYSLAGFVIARRKSLLLNGTLRWLIPAGEILDRHDQRRVVDDPRLTIDNCR